MTVVVDSHVHVWDDRVLDYPWLAGTDLAGPHLPADVDDAAGTVTGWIFIEADVRADLRAREHEWVAGLGWTGLCGIVAAVDVADPRERPARLAATAARPLTVGIRHLLQGLPVGSVTAAELARGVAETGAAGLSFDACVRHEQLGELEHLAAAAPSTLIVLDHLGKPPVREGYTSPASRAWASALTRLARRENVVVKLSGLRAECEDAATLRLHASAYLHTAIDAFGPDRCMYGSDWPVSTGTLAGTTGREWIDLVRTAVSSAGSGAWDAVAHHTVNRAYPRITSLS